MRTDFGNGLFLLFLAILHQGKTKPPAGDEEKLFRRSIIRNPVREEEFLPQRCGERWIFEEPLQKKIESSSRDTGGLQERIIALPNSDASPRSILQGISPGSL